MSASVVFLSCLLSIFSLSHATTEWWGDLRAHLNPDKSPAFYDVTYDETECPEGLRSDAIPDYVYFGTMLATMSVEDHESCIRRCLDKPRCKAVNYFAPLAYQERGFCELLLQTQTDNPRLMKPFRRATYYDNIRCRATGTDDHVDIPKDKPSTRPVTIPAKGDKEDVNQMMKKLSAKVAEFNQQFRLRAARL